jgi:hypothetical protein
MRAPLGWSVAWALQLRVPPADGPPVGALRRSTRVRLPRVPVPFAAMLLPAALLAPVVPASVAPTSVAPASAATSCGRADLLVRTPLGSAHPASGVVVRAWNGTDPHGHAVRLTVAETDLRRARLAASVPGSYGDVASTTSLTGGVRRAVAGINGDYFSYDWSGDAVPDGPLVVDGRILRLPAGSHPAVGADASGRPFAASLRPTGSVRWTSVTLPVGSVNADLDPDRPDAVSAGRAVAVVTPWLGASRPTRRREVVVRRGRVVATGHRLSFGAGRTFGSGSAGRHDVLLAAGGAAGRRLGALRRGTVVRVSYRVAASTGVRPVQAVGSGAAMLRGGRVLPGCSGSAALSRPRTLLAWTADRSRLWLVTVDGRGGSAPVSRYGSSYRQVADAVRGLGATEAVMLDGGGSTTMAVRGADGRVRRTDAMAGTPQRPVPDALVVLRR